MSNRRRYVRRRVAKVLSSELSAWGGKRYYSVLLACGHREHTKNNACQEPPETARCVDCTVERESKEEPRDR